jgi:hypothetical protein
MILFSLSCASDIFAAVVSLMLTLILIASSAFRHIDAAAALPPFHADYFAAVMPRDDRDAARRRLRHYA